MEKKFVCKICGKTSSAKIIKIKEQMIGTFEEFEYYECEHCKSLQIINVPTDMSKYYNNNYYSFISRPFLLYTLIKHLNKSYFSKDFTGSIVKKFYTENEELYKLLSDLIKNNKIYYNSKILDIGCGNGTFLENLADLGFTDLNGMEPFIEEDLKNEKFCIFKSFINEFYPKKNYDLIFLKDSLEHMENPYESLLKSKELLNDKGYLIITIPIKTEYFYKLYGTNWYQLDAPRHFIIFSLRGFETMIKKLDLNIEKIIFNSDPYSIFISEDYALGESMYSTNSYLTNNHLKNTLKRRYKKIELKVLNKKTTYNNLKPFINELNEKECSEHAIFLIKK